MGTVAQKLQKLLEIKEAIRQAIIGKGQSVASTLPFSSYPAKIAAIQTGVETSDATAVAGDILSGKTAYAKGKKLVGTMPSVVQATPSITVDSAGKITASAAQGAGYVAAGTKSATKQLTTQAAKTVTPGASSQTAVVSGRYTTGAVTVAGDSNLAAGNIKSGVSIFGVTGTLASADRQITCTIKNNTTWSISVETPTESITVYPNYFEYINIKPNNSIFVSVFNRSWEESTSPYKVGSGSTNVERIMTRRLYTDRAYNGKWCSETEFIFSDAGTLCVVEE